MKEWEKTYKMIEKEIDEAVANLKFIIFKRLKEEAWQKMRICDSCKKPIPYGTSNIIEVNFRGKFGKLASFILKTTNCDFCSLECFNTFNLTEEGSNKKWVRR